MPVTQELIDMAREQKLLEATGTLNANDSYTVSPGSSSDAGEIEVQLSGAAAATLASHCARAR